MQRKSGAANAQSKDYFVVCYKISVANVVAGKPVQLFLRNYTKNAECFFESADQKTQVQRAASRLFDLSYRKIRQVFGVVNTGRARQNSPDTPGILIQACMPMQRITSST